MTGKNLNQRPDCSASRWVINLRDWPLERAERRYPDVVDIVRRLVKPERDRNDRASYRDFWWRYGEHRPGLYAAVDNLDHALALSLVSNLVMPVRVPTLHVFAHVCAVFALDDFASLAILSSSAHTSWVIRYTSTMRTDIRYAPSDVFLTLPRPRPTPELERLGERLGTGRRAVPAGLSARRPASSFSTGFSRRTTAVTPSRADDTAWRHPRHPTFRRGGGSRSGRAALGGGAAQGSLALRPPAAARQLLEHGPARRRRARSRFVVRRAARHR